MWDWFWLVLFMGFTTFVIIVVGLIFVTAIYYIQNGRD